MKRPLKKLLVIAAVFILFMILICGVVMIRMNKQINAFDTTPVDINNVTDGVYEGHSSTDLVKADVRVTVSDGKISDINIIRHECGKGRPAEKMIPVMIQNNDVEVDAISGATVSSAVIKDAVRDALRKGYNNN